MLVKLATTLRVSADEILGIPPPKKDTPPANRRFLRRLKAVDQLRLRDQKELFRTIDAFLAARKAD